jgi:hypothetical protein
MYTSIPELTAAYERERSQRHPVVNAAEIPFSYEDITAAWLTAVLCTKHPGTQVVSCGLDEPDNGSSNRRRIFIEYNEAGQKAGLPGSVFCKGSQGLANRVLMASIGVVEGEVYFYNRVRALLDIEAPISYWANMDASTMNSIVMLADMGRDLMFCTHTTDISYERAQDQVGLLARMHGRFLESPQLRGELAVFHTYADFFDKQVAVGFEPACDKGFEMAEDVIPKRLFARRQEIWPATLKSAACHINASHTLLHGDSHLRNWYIAPAGAMGLADWQATSRGHWARDLSYTMTTSLPVERRRQWQDELMRYYADRLHEASGQRVSIAEVAEQFRRHLLTGLAAWTVTVNPVPGFPDMQPADSALEFVHRLATAIDDLDALDCYD